jgi:transposase
MGRKIIQVSGKTAEEIKEMFNTDKKLKQGYRLYAVYQVSKGKKPQDLEDVYNTSFKSINNWVHRFNREGLQGLLDKPIPGRKPKLTESEKEEIKRLIQEDLPEIHGYNSATWTGPMIINYIEREFGKTYKKAQIYKILAKLNLTYQKSKGIYPEANNERRGEIVEELKKTSE